MKRLALRNNKRGQATTELAVMGSIVIILLAYLMQQGFLYNSRQSLEMYTFRQALQLSRAYEKGISLTVIRDVFAPSFFSGLSRQRLMASSSVDYNPYIVYNPEENSPQDISTRQLIQINDAMIDNGSFLEVPPTKIKTGATQGKWIWTGSPVKDIEYRQSTKVKTAYPTSAYNYLTTLQEDSSGKAVSRELETSDALKTSITFETADKMQENYTLDAWEGTSGEMEVDKATIPKDVTVSWEETVKRGKHVWTAH